MDIRQTGCEIVCQDKSNECFLGDHDYKTSGTTHTCLANAKQRLGKQPLLGKT
jgi:hypothetical protein